MQEIVDYYKNSKFYQDDLISLSSYDLTNYKIDNKLKELVQRFDELTFSKRKILDELKFNVIYNDCELGNDELAFEKDNFKIEIKYYYDISHNFVIFGFLSGSYTLDKVPITVEHVFCSDSQIIVIRRDYRDHMNGFIPIINLNTMKADYINEEKINKVIDNLSVFNNSLERVYQKQESNKKLVQIKKRW